MTTSQRTFTCLRCRLRTALIQLRCFYHATDEAAKPTIAPKVSIDVKHIRQNTALHEQNCLERNYQTQAAYPVRIKNLHEKWHTYQHEARSLRERNNRLKSQLSHSASTGYETEKAQELSKMSKEELVCEARSLKEQLAIIKARESEVMSQIDLMALAMPNLTSDETPRGTEPVVVGYINSALLLNLKPEPWPSHVDIGQKFNLLDFAAAATSSGWGWYYLINEAAALEQALVQYALSVVSAHGWGMVSPPSMVYSHIADACGFQPRDANGEQQIYSIAQNPRDTGRKPEMSLTATAEISLAAMKANSTLSIASLPVKQVGVSRCYRAEAGARGADTKGLYRVHEFTKVEMFAWAFPSVAHSTAVFDEMLSIQTAILTGLQLPCRILEMPSTDLGASASRKRDIEAFFPGRRKVGHGWGELTSVSTCGDYQSRRLATRMATDRIGSTAWPYTVNGTALAVPRVLAALLENHFCVETEEIRIPEVLWPWMNGVKVIRKKD